MTVPPRPEFADLLLRLVAQHETSFAELARTCERLERQIEELRSEVPFGWSTVERYGAVGDGKTDDTAALQRAFDECDHVEFARAGRYLVRGISLPDKRLTVSGNGATLVAAAKDNAGFVLGSANFTANIPRPQKPFAITGLSIDGAGVADHGLIWQSWDSRFADARVANCRQSGILITAQTKDGSGFDRETLVENRLLGIKSWQNGGHGLEVRDRARNKVTDGTVRDCVFCRNGGYGLHFDGGAGWLVQAHTYSNQSGGIYFSAAGAGTRIAQCYLEDGQVDGSTENPPNAHALWIDDVINTGFVALHGNYFGGLVGNRGTGNRPPNGICSVGNVYGPRGGLMPPRDGKATNMSIGDVFVGDLGRQQWPEHRGAVMATADIDVAAWAGTKERRARGDEWRRRD